jgi:hypothetical protein
MTRRIAAAALTIAVPMGRHFHSRHPHTHRRPRVGLVIADTLTALAVYGLVASLFAASFYYLWMDK